MTETTIVYGSSNKDREHAIASRLNKTINNIVIAEGIANSTSILANMAEQNICQVFRIAPGCPCCTGNLTMRVTLNRILRQPPQAIYLCLASSTHLQEIRKFLQDPQYVNLLSLTEDINCELPVLIR
jgi:hypothetical protein